MTVAKPISVDIYCRRSRLFLGLTMKIKSVPALPLLAALNANAMLSHLVNHFVSHAQLNVAPSTQPISPPSYDRTNSSVSRALLFSAALLLSLFALSSSPVQASSESTEAAHQESLLTLSAEQRQLAGVEVAQLSATAFNLQAVATAQLVVDKDKTITIAPQADYVNAATEWDRIKRMSKGTISASQRMQTEVNAELKRAILQSVMMSTKQIAELATSPSSIGQFQLLAPINGRVQQDIATVGQVLTAGTPLMQLTDESYLWVEAELTPLQADQVNMGTDVLVRVGSRTRDGVIIGRSHEINSQTRTEQVLVRMANPGHDLHAGEFAELYLAANQGAEPLGFIVPDAALTRGGDGDWQVFIEQDGGFSAVEVSVVERQRGLSFIRGLVPQTRVVVSGAFFLASEQAKSGFDIHNH